MTREEILAKLKESIVEMDEDLAEEAAHEALEAGLDPLIAITDGLSEGMLVVSDLFDIGEAFVPQLMVAAEAFEKAVEVLTSNLTDDEKQASKVGKVLIHTVQGDVHDIGKNIVKTMFEANNFQVFDLGRDVQVELVVEKAKEYLQNTEMKTYEISEAVGVEDAGYFSKMFKKITGVSPKEFRKREQHEEKN